MKGRRAFRVRKRCNEAAAAGDGSRKGTEVKTGDDRQRAERTDEEFVQVVAGYVFHDAAAGLAEMAGAVDEFGADEEIAGGAVELLQRRMEAGGDGAADGTARIPGDEKREELFVFVESGIQFRQGDS